MKKPNRRELRQIMAALGCAVAIGLCGALFYWMTTESSLPVGDAAKVEEILLGSALEGERLIRLTESNPGMLLSSILFEREQTSAQTYDIGAGDGIEFLPILTEKHAHDYLLRVLFETENDRVEIGRAPMIPAPGLWSGVTGDILAGFTRMDLSALAGKHGKFVWQVIGDSPPPAAICGFKFIKAQPEPRPSIMLICSDTHRYDYSLAGRGPELMPHFTDFASRATIFDRAFSTASWTLPSVTSVLTGRFPRFHLTGQRVHTGLSTDLDAEDIPDGNFVAVWGPTYHQFTTYPHDLVSLPEALRGAGYTTVLIFANAFFWLSGLHADGFDVVLDASVMPGRTINYLADSVLDSLPRDRPIFLYVHYLDAHEYMIVHKEMTLSKAEAAGKSLPDYSPYGSPPDSVREAYAQGIREVDEHLAGLLARWDERNAGSENLVVFYSDHGEHLFDPGHPKIDAELSKANPKENQRALSLPILNHGNSMDETLLHVPLVIRFPTGLGIAPGRISTGVSLVDIMPTILKIAGVEADTTGMDWKSLIPNDESGTAGDPRCLFADFQLYGDERSSVRREFHKLTLNLEDEARRSANTPGQVLIDTRMASDLGESGQIVNDQAVTNELSGIFGGYAEAALESTKGLTSTHSPELNRTTEELKRLGYIQ